jgi:prepilin-type N-terminal cleavage/methylation domain-containing protein
LYCHFRKLLEFLLTSYPNKIYYNHMLNKNKGLSWVSRSTALKGFTIVELLVVIVTIGILAAITMVSYSGVTQRATEAVLQSDLANASKRLKMYFTEYGYYPTTLDANNCPSTPTADPNYCIKPSIGNTLTYLSVSPITFHLTNTKGSSSYSITNSSRPTVATTISTCPAGFIPVPGSGTYNTNDFCVMKYEAKNVSGVATSQASNTPWSSISQTSSMSTAANACSGCHLITEFEWMTIAQNVLSVPSNWSGGAVGSGYIYSGHCDNSPGSSLAATTDDSDGGGVVNAGGYFGTGDSSTDVGVTNGMVGMSQRRTLTLTNGSVIWDIAGNLWEWTSSQTAGGQPGVTGAGYGTYDREWPDVTNPGTIIPNPAPSTTGIANAGSWTSANGVGRIWSSTEETVLHGFFRGGSWNNLTIAGPLALSLGNVPSYTGTARGFRVAR